MENSFYTELAKFRVLTCIGMKTTRSSDAVYRTIDNTLTRICNSIKKGYALKDRAKAFGEIQRRYPYFEVTIADIYSQRDMEVVIRRRTENSSISITVTEDNLGKFEAWCNVWSPAKKPKTLEELAEFNPNQRYW